MKNKKAVSEIIGYVMLISISLTLASLVFVWLKGYLPSNEGEIQCEENTAIIITDYNYSYSQNFLNITISNKGLFDVDGYILRVSNESLRDVGIYTLNRSGIPLQVGETYYDVYTSFETDEVLPKEITGRLYLIEIQPLIKKSGKFRYCNDFISKAKLV